MAARTSLVTKSCAERLQGSETTIVANNTGNTKTTYNDTTADPNVAHYFYVVKAINGQGTGSQSNEIDLTVSPTPPPVVPYSCSGINVATDPAGDAVNPAPGGQGPTSQADITAVSFSADATNLTTKLTIANLSATPLPGNTFTSYYVAWTSNDGVSYGTRVNVRGQIPQLSPTHGGRGTQLITGLPVLIARLAPLLPA